MRYKYAWTTLILIGLMLAGCTNDGGDSTTGSNRASPQATQREFNDADVAFATDMIPHHQQAIVMAAVAAERAQMPEVKDLASAIQAAQQPEIDTMSAWLLGWGKPVPEGTMGMGSHGGMPSDDMPGMMTADEMNQLHAGTGPSFDRMFLTMMIEHHEGAIRMAEIEQANGLNADAVALAKKIAKDQQAEIETMQPLLGS